ncbi:YgiT-type zinc finger protein [Acidobacteria bacterium AH-259-L09]|nr:YgiT-type zinc finger protein [Acidobacteria bacterium AH-259-L09]
MREPPRKPFSSCPICAGQLVEKNVEKLLRGGKHTAILRVEAEVCLKCGERLYPIETARRFEEVRKKLEAGQVDSFNPIGTAYEVA